MASDQAADDGSTARSGSSLLATHAVLVLLALGAWLASDVGYQEQDEIDVLKLVAAAYLFLAGLPWSFAAVDPVSNSDDDHVSEPWRTVLLVAPALINLVLHAAFRVWRRR